MSVSTTLSVDPEVKQRLEAMADARGIEAADLLAELVGQAETAQLVAEVDQELERLAQGPGARQDEREQLRELEATVSGWMSE